MNRLTETEFADFKMKVKRLDKEKGNHYAFGAIRGAVFLNALTTKQQEDLIKMVW